MKNNELRIGNYVQHKGEIVKVEQITKHKIGYHRYKNKNTMQYLRVSEIEPIEITEDFLLQKGFEKKYLKVFSQSCLVYNDEEVILRLHSKPYYWFLMIDFGLLTLNKQMKSIHELQNAYYIVSGKELNLKF